MNDDELIQTILAAPEDDEPRQTLAERLEERRDPRGELIRIQLEIAEIHRTQGSLEALAGLLHEQQWTAPVRDQVTRARLHRGFVEEISLGAPDFLARAEALYRIAPVLHLNLLDAAGAMREVCASPALARIVSIRLDGQQIGDEGARAIADSPHLRKLTWLDLGENGVTRAGLEALFASPNLPRLRWLDLRDNDVEEPADQPEGYDESFIIGWKPSAIGAELEARYGRRAFCHYQASFSMFYPPRRGAFLDVARAPLEGERG
jgi:uncharacterized protein (TIGR02996 family)